MEKLIVERRVPCALHVHFAFLAGLDRRHYVDAEHIPCRSIRRHDDPKAYWPSAGGSGIDPGP